MNKTILLEWLGTVAVIGDGCPNDSRKGAPGPCGCGTPDTDTDKYGMADCNDQCLVNPGKITPGRCGCELADTDSDGDGTADCNNKCPADPTRIAGCDSSGTIANTPAPTPVPQLLTAPRVKVKNRTARVWVIGKFSAKDRVSFSIIGPTKSTVGGKRFKAAKGSSRFKANFSKLANGTYQASWQVLREGVTAQQSS